MKRRSRAGGNPAKARPHSALKARGRNAPKSVSNRRSAADNSESEIAQLKRELHEALEQQTATSDVLQVISSSPGDLEPVFQAMLEKAVRICGARFGNLFLCEDGAFRVVAMHNAPPAYAEARMLAPIHPGPATALGRLARTKQAAQIDDLMAEPGYVGRDPLMVTGVEVGGIRTLVAVPMLKANELVGGGARRCGRMPTHERKRRCRKSAQRATRRGRPIDFPQCSQHHGICRRNAGLFGSRPLPTLFEQKMG